MDIKKMTLEEYRIWRNTVSKIGKVQTSKKYPQTQQPKEEK